MSLALVAVLAVLAAAGAARRAAAEGNQPTACVHLCADLGDPCVVTNKTVTVSPGSVIDCGTRAVEVRSDGVLTVADGRFVLKAGSLAVMNNGRINATCPALSGKQGFSLQVTGAITLANASKLDARCDAGGGAVMLTAGGAIDVGAAGSAVAIDASGTGATAGGGSVLIRAGGAVTTSSEIRAATTSTGGEAPGGEIDISGSSITIGQGMSVAGMGSWRGGHISLDATGDVTVSGGFLVDATTGGNGTGGEISITAGGTARVDRPLRARGNGAGSVGGLVEIEGQTVLVNQDLLATGGQRGGQIRLQASRGSVEIGSGTSDQLTLDVGISSNNPGVAGEISIASSGNAVVVAGAARLYANGASGGTGGSVALRGVTITAASGTEMVADGVANSGGVLSLVARDQMTLSGLARASNGGIDLFYRSTAPSLGAGVQCPCNQMQDADLPVPCGDDVQRAGVEACDGSDLADQTCASLGHGSGSLTCGPSCAFVFSGCSN